MFFPDDTVGRSRLATSTLVGATGIQMPAAIPANLDKAHQAGGPPAIRARR